MSSIPPPPTVRITSETGGQKDKKLAQLGALDPLAILTVAEVAGAGAEKYARYNFLKGYDWSLSYDALQRHLHLMWSGQDYDQESGQPHVAHAAWHCLTLLSFLQRDLGTDDRFVQEGSALDEGSDWIDTDRAGVDITQSPSLGVQVEVTEGVGGLDRQIRESVQAKVPVDSFDLPPRRSEMESWHDFKKGIHDTRPLLDRLLRRR